MELCKYTDCGRSERYRGYCQEHYYQLLYSGELPRVRKKAIRSEAERLIGKYIIDPESGCWIWLAGLVKGYAVIGCTSDNRPYRRASHVSYEIKYGPIPESSHMLHNCDNRKCINPDHLFPGSQLDNIRDCIKKKRHVCQTKNEQKLTFAMAQTIRILYARGRHSIPSLAEIYSVDPATIGCVVKGRNHLKPNLSAGNSAAFR